MTRATAIAPANIAFTKFWGWRNEALTLPFHDTISMTLSECWSRTTVGPARGNEDEVLLLDPAGHELEAGPAFRSRVAAYLDFLRGGRGPAIRVVTTNSMPMSTGVASSASGFAALTVATVAALGLEADEETLSAWARRSGSGSAARSIPAGFVRWYAGERDDGKDSCARSLHPPGYWNLNDILAVVETAPKAVSSRDGHRDAPTSPRFRARLEAMPARNMAVATAIRDRNLAHLGPLLEEEALSLQEIAETSERPVRYRTPATDAVIARVRSLRGEGLGAWFTLDAGPNVHVISEAGDSQEIRRALEGLPEVRYTMVNVPSQGARLDDQHLF